MMLMKSQLMAMTPDHRAFALVGGFMGFFALLEAGVDSAIGKVLGVDGIRRAIVGRNMGFDDKIKTLRTLVAVYLPENAEKTAFDKLAVRARKMGEHRNIIAHTPFRGSTNSDGVEFLRVTATSKLEFPEMDWSIDEFIQNIDEINSIDGAFRRFEQGRPISAVADALLANKAPQFGALFNLGAEALHQQK
jgi:hypothetical protein